MLALFLYRYRIYTGTDGFPCTIIHEYGCSAHKYCQQFQNSQLLWQLTTVSAWPRVSWPLGLHSAVGQEVRGC